MSSGGVGGQRGGGVFALRIRICHIIVHTRCVCVLGLGSRGVRRDVFAHVCGPHWGEASACVVVVVVSGCATDIAPRNRKQALAHYLLPSFPYLPASA